MIWWPIYYIMKLVCPNSGVSVALVEKPGGKKLGSTTLMNVQKQIGLGNLTGWEEASVTFGAAQNLWDAERWVVLGEEILATENSALVGWLLGAIM